MLCPLLCLGLGLEETDAQASQVDMTKWITLTVKQGAEIKLDFSGSPSDVWVKVTGVENEKEEKVTTSLAGKKEYKATGTTLIVYGAITVFGCSDNEGNLTTLDVSRNGNLTYLNCSNNQLSSLDVSRNGNLTKLYCYHNQLSSLDVSRNVNLTYLNCSENQLSSLDVSRNGNLTDLDCSDNRLYSLDVSKNGNLTYLFCYSNRLYSLDVSKNGNLTYLDCSDNRLSSLDVSRNGNLTRLHCSDNRLSSLDVSKNGNLTYLRCYNNQLSSLDVSRNGNLTDLDCSGDRLSSLDVTRNSNLIYLDCSNNQLSSLDVTRNGNLTYLLCSDNRLASLDVSKNELLEKLHICGNLFSTSTLNNLYCQLPDRTGKQKIGMIFPVLRSGDIEVRLVQSSSKAVADAKNWKIMYWEGWDDIRDITGNYRCGTPCALTLAPATLPHSLAYQGETWETVVTSTGEWSLDVATLPAWLSVSPRQGNSGTKVTVTAQPNTGFQVRDAALAFTLINGNTTKQVVVLRQNAERIYVDQVGEYTFPAAGETKANYFTVESTGEWSVTSPSAWCMVEPKGGEAGTKQVTVKVEVNSKKEARIAALTFALKANANIKQVVTVKQAGRGSNQNPSAVENALFSGIAVAPNPFGVQLVIKNSEGRKGRYELVSMGGVLVRSGSLQGRVVVLSTAGLKAGVYLLRILAGGGAKTFSVVKE